VLPTYTDDSISDCQPQTMARLLRGARGVLGLSQAAIGQVAPVCANTIAALENPCGEGGHLHVGGMRPQRIASIVALIAFYASLGVTVRLLPPRVELGDIHVMSSPLH